MGSMSVLSCSCCMILSCVHSAEVLMLRSANVDAGRGCKRRPCERGILQNGSHD